jgi:surface polysaccharide O-acyltransferase-like enzyme
MTRYLSDKLRVLSFIAMVMVVVLHAYKAPLSYHLGNPLLNGGYAFFIQIFFSEGITRIAVPLFFLISGYLFFLNFNATVSEFALKYKRRAKSLLVPYLLWSAWGLGFYAVLQLPAASRHFFTNDLVLDYSFMKILDTLFLNPIPYQLWFLRDLMVLVALSPLISKCLQYLKFVPVLLLFIAWLVFFKFSFVVFRTESFFFFSLGAYLSTTKSTIPLISLNKHCYWIAGLIWTLTAFFKALLIWQNSGEMMLIVLLGRLSILSGMLTVWSLYDMMMRNKESPNELLFRLSAFSFFIYAFHEPVLTVVQKGLFYLTGASEPMILLNYVLAPVLTVSLGVSSGILLKRCMPLFYSLITGGR